MYCGCGTAGNRTQWALFLCLSLIGMVLAIVSLTQQNKCRICSIADGSCEDLRGSDWHSLDEATEGMNKSAHTVRFPRRCLYAGTQKGAYLTYVLVVAIHCRIQHPAAMYCRDQDTKSLRSRNRACVDSNCASNPQEVHCITHVCNVHVLLALMLDSLRYRWSGLLHCVTSLNTSWLI